jgi:PiT family inorganic phosphate transporter
MTLVVAIIILALIFDYINGFHDAANAIATIVSTKVLTPIQAVLWAAMFNFGAFFLFKDHAVANTISKTVVDTYITLEVILAGIIAAILWNLLTWWYGIPSSSSHTLIGGFAGAAIAHAFTVKGFMPLSDIVASDKIMKTVYFIFLAPIIGMLISAFITLVTIKRNLWGRFAIMILASIFTFFIFDYFMGVKLEQNLSKFYRVEKYQKQALKNPEDANAQANYLLAKSHYEESLPFLINYKNNGGQFVVDNILKSVNLNDVSINKQREIVEKFLKYEAVKKEAFFNVEAQTKLALVEHKITACIPVFEQYEQLGSEETARKISSIIELGEAQQAKFISEYHIDIKKSLLKDLDKADNRQLTYMMMIFFAIFGLVYLYVEVYRKPTAAKMNQMFKKLQLLSSAAFSLGHGGSDAQKVMGIIGAALIANGNIIDFKEIPNWVPLACYTAIALGTLSGGWKIVKTMGTKITKVTPLEGVGAETAGAITLFLTAQMGIPVSTTHTITGSIIGVGATKRLSAVRWGVTRSLLFAWIVTIPISAIVAALTYWVVMAF